MSQAKKSSTAILNAAQFNASGPGTILADFETLLSFIGTGGLKSGGKNFRIPLAALNDLDERMVHPLRPKLNRPQQLSFPHLNGLYLLLRSSGLGIAQGQGTSGRLLLNPHVFPQWIALNPVEKYVTLLQSMLSSTWNLISADESSHDGPWRQIGWLQDFQSQGRARNSAKGAGIPASECFMGWNEQTTAALLELFGIFEIPREQPGDGENWRIKSVRTTEFGEAMLGRLSEYVISCAASDFAMSRTTRKAQWLGEGLQDVFPDCQNTLVPPEPEFLDGVWQFKVSWDNVWRRIEIPANLSAQDLVDEILDAFKFDSDHLYEFQLRDRSGRVMKLGHEVLEGIDAVCDEFEIGYLPLDPGQSMLFRYDFGFDWQFDVQLEKILPRNESLTAPRTTAKKGNSPRQYDIDDWGEGEEA